MTFTYEIVISLISSSTKPVFLAGRILQLQYKQGLLSSFRLLLASAQNRSSQRWNLKQYQKQQMDLRLCLCSKGQRLRIIQEKSWKATVCNHLSWEDIENHSRELELRIRRQGDGQNNGSQPSVVIKIIRLIFSRWQVFFGCVPL